ncbi:uncharacterized protein TNCV_592991 [Trichonephila clavipes]|nr:uncharacterized protein TNCV_592991 [Trichonephila clavipes]
MPSIGGYHPYGLASILSDLNPKEHVWDTLGRRIAARQPLSTCLPELRRTLLDEWCNIPKEQIDNLILSMPRRCFFVASESAFAVNSGSSGEFIRVGFLLPRSERLPLLFYNLKTTTVAGLACNFEKYCQDEAHRMVPVVKGVWKGAKRMAKMSSTGRPLSNDTFSDSMHPFAPEEIEAQVRADKHKYKHVFTAFNKRDETKFNKFRNTGQHDELVILPRTVRLKIFVFIAMKEFD